VGGAIKMLDISGIINEVLMGLSLYVFGHMEITCIAIILALTIICLLIQIPLPVALALMLPFITILTAWGYMSIMTGGLFASGYLVIAILSFYKNVGLE
jgi:hypothetical protein